MNFEISQSDSMNSILYQPPTASIYYIWLEMCNIYLLLIIVMFETFFFCKWGLHRNTGTVWAKFRARNCFGAFLGTPAWLAALVSVEDSTVHITKTWVQATIKAVLKKSRRNSCKTAWQDIHDVNFAICVTSRTHKTFIQLFIRFMPN